MAPSIVCASFADDSTTSLVLRDEGLDWFAARVGRDPIVGVNVFYDLGCAMAARPELVAKIFDAIERGTILDAPLMEALHDNARGLLYREANGAPFGRYSLQLLEGRYLGIDREEQKHGENAWRLRYKELDGVPLEQWPAEAIQYPRADARNTYDVAAKQLAAPRRYHVGVGDPEPGEEGDFSQRERCSLCGQYAPRSRGFAFETEECPNAPLTETRQNLHCLGGEMRSGLVLSLASLWGMRTDPVLVPVVVAEIKRKHEESRRRFFLEGIVRVRPCTKKKNKDTGLSEYERGDEISMEWLEEMLVALTPNTNTTPSGTTTEPQTPWLLERRADVVRCMDALRKNRPIRFAQDTGWLETLVERAYQGNPPKTAGGASGVQKTSTSRDTLDESGDELLEAYAAEGENEKLLSTYVKVLEQGVTVPINPQTTILLATDRVSYSRPNLQQLPRGSAADNVFLEAASKALGYFR